MELFGNHTALITPFNKNKTIDFKTLKSLVQFQLSHKTNGIVALGSTAEAPTLTSQEKRQILSTITSEVEKKIPIIAGINAFSLADALLQARQRFVDGANAILVAPPPYIKPTEKGLLGFFKTLADQSYIPIILYNIPSRTGTNLPLSLVKTLSTHPNIIGIKEASGDINYSLNLSTNICNCDFSLLAGNDNQLIPMLAIGARGVISVAGNVIPHILQEITTLYHNNKAIQSLNLYKNFSSFIDILGIESNPIPIKYVMHQLNMLKPYYREPLCPPTNKHKQKINSFLNNFIFL